MRKKKLHNDHNDDLYYSIHTQAAAAAIAAHSLTIAAAVVVIGRHCVCVLPLIALAWLPICVYLFKCPAS